MTTPTTPAGPEQPRFCIYSDFAKKYVKRLSFTDTGVLIDFTKNESMAARVSQRDKADYLARIVPKGSVFQHAGKKPSMEETLQEIKDHAP